MAVLDRRCTKAGTLEWLRGRLGAVHILPQLDFTVQAWRLAGNRLPGAVGRALAHSPWSHAPLIVRSSAVSEDQNEQSNAGRYLSLAGIRGRDAVEAAVSGVIASYGDGDPNDEVLIQPMLEDVAMSGVAFSWDPNTGAPYRIINYDPVTGRTDSVTAGDGRMLETFVCVRNSPTQPEDPRLAQILSLMDELEATMGNDALDVEFAFDRGGHLYLFQARPLVLRRSMSGSLADAQASHLAHLQAIAHKLECGMRPHPFLNGRTTVYGVMPDWNPAEIIGIRPRPLALSLYRNIVTDSVWAYQRDNYGYKNLRSFPLMLHFFGLPYIDTRVSFNSFLPKDIGSEMAERLINYYIDRLLEAPSLHDKVEFKIIFSCYSFDIDERLRGLKEYGFTPEDCRTLRDSLRRLTNGIIGSEAGLWRRDLERLDILLERRSAIMSGDLDPVSRIYWLLEDCKRYGTLPFAGLARAGFIAVQLLHSLVAIGVLSDGEVSAFMEGLNTVGSRLSQDLAELPPAAFQAKYGHLRPGTYDILSPRYDEAMESYFDASRPVRADVARPAGFALSLTQMSEIKRLLAIHGLDYDVVGLFEFLKAAIEGREYAKFVFTRNLSDAISLVRDLGEQHGFSADDMSYFNIEAIGEMQASCVPVRDLIARSIESGRSQFAAGSSILLPPLITRPDQVWMHHVPRTEPNFITARSAIGPVCNDPASGDLAGTIVFIPSADPGFDWLFSRGIAGFVTAYGGMNSHMAIRAGELGLPAVIGAGDILFQRWSQARILRLDCGARRVDLL
ncbi:PEP-utilizing enzyme [Azospirillum largimobile]